MNKNKKSYQHLKKAERLEISILLKRGYGVRDIASTLERSPGTISEEIKNNSVNGIYDPFKANHKAYVKRKYSKYQGMKVVKNLELRNYVEKKLQEDWSPEEISGRINNIEKHLKYISAKGIYKFIDSPYGDSKGLRCCLRHKGKKRNKKRVKVTQLEDRIFIDKRPKIIEKRVNFGDWEGDFIVSGKNGKGALLVFYERKSRYTVIRKINSRSTRIVNQHVKEITGEFVHFNSLTLDNDISFAKHVEMSELISAPVYFCHPYHSWEKGGVENINKLIRQYIPKGSDISRYDKEEIKVIEDTLNDRPKKCLDFKTPLEVMEENDQFKKIKYFDIININLVEQKRAECSA
ncbi:IS30 family transposase [Patescibacteria group bacterium]|nr:IS30 family transposase [Patescibacteria group bacterium]